MRCSPRLGLSSNPPFYEDTLKTLSALSNLLQGPVSKSGRILRCGGLGFQHVNSGGGKSAHNKGLRTRALRFLVFFFLIKPNDPSPVCVFASAAHPLSFSRLIAVTARVQMGPRLSNSPGRRAPLPAVGPARVWRTTCRLVPGDGRLLPGSLATESSSVLPAPRTGLLIFLSRGVQAAATPLGPLTQRTVFIFN